MSKKRWPRRSLGTLERADGVRVEVKNPTIWKQLLEQQQAITAQREMLQQLQGAIAKIEAERDEQARRLSLVRRAFDDVAASWWVSLGVRLGLVRLREVPAPSVASPQSPAPSNPEAIPAA